MAGLAEHRGPEADDFWTWREAMYRFLDRLEPDDVVAIAAQAYVEMLESGFTRVGEFHYLHHAPDGSAYANPGEMMVSIAEAADRTGIGLTLLPVFYAHGGFGGAAPTAGQRRFITDIESFARLVESARRAVARLDGAQRRRRTPQPARRDAGRAAKVLELERSGPCTCTRPSRSAKSTTASPGRGSGPWNGSSITPASIGAGASCTPRT